jgi:L-rhamnose mutarotase
MMHLPFPLGPSISRNPTQLQERLSIVYIFALESLSVIQRQKLKNNVERGMKIVKRIAFLLRLKPGKGPDYDLAHAAVWPEMLALLKRAGISEYSIFRRDEDFEVVWQRIDQDPVNLKWQHAMSEFFESDHGARPGERFPMMREVFYLP